MLEDLDLTHANLNGSGLKVLAALPNLKHLSLYESKVTNLEGLENSRTSNLST